MGHYHYPALRSGAGYWANKYLQEGRTFEEFVAFCEKNPNSMGWVPQSEFEWRAKAAMYRLSQPETT